MLNQARTRFDVVIIGGGVGGLSTALWADELALSALVLEETAELGGQLLRVYNEIKNYLGKEAKNGRELRDAFLEQIEKRAFELLLNARISEVDLEKKEISLIDGRRFSARALVVATGVRRRRLSAAGEEEFAGRGVIESGKKNAALLEGKNILIVGGGDAAFENALILAESAARVTIAHRRQNFRARAEFIEQVTNHPKIEILTGTRVEKISGKERLEAVELKNSVTGEARILPTDALLIRIGVEPNTEIFRGQLKLDEAGYIEIDRNCATGVRGVFAVGDVANPLAPTVASAAGMGATAAKTIFSLLNS
ncbi:MAG TPA: FAD-dependent oxidoreductase [Pyrinomonadaceae bacterium]|jgi:thioredoxin reductase (NADPH)